MKIFFLILTLFISLLSFGQLTNVTGNTPQYWYNLPSSATADSTIGFKNGYNNKVFRVPYGGGGGSGNVIGTGNGAATRATFWNSSTTITGIANFIMDSASQNFHIFNSGAVSTGAGLTINGTNDGSNIHFLHNDKFRLSIAGTVNGSIGNILPQSSILVALNATATYPIGFYVVPAADGDNVFIVSNAAKSVNRAIFRGDGTTLLAQSAGSVGVGVSSPTAALHLKAGTSSANTAPLKINSGTNLTTPEDGAIEYDGTNLSLDVSTTRYTLAKVLTASATLDFGSTGAQSSSDLTITVTGAAVNDPVILGIPNASILASATSFYAWVSATNTVTVRFVNAASGSGDPSSGTFKVAVLKY